ncbi:MAG: DUF4956 domain-containing protein [Parcubacteria group bacterium]|nr:DUF4956 domain-containing protein [Parcubacteria group bacterium]
MDNFYNLTSTEISAAVILFNLFLSFVLQLAIVYIYKRTHKGLSYSPSFIFTLVLVGVLGTVVMMIVQNNLIGAFALLGAFSLIRFRTILKETRDIAFVFFALVIGIAVGTDHYSIALISTFFISIIIIALYHYNIGNMTSNIGLVLSFNASNDLNTDEIRSLLSSNTTSHIFLRAKNYGNDINNYTFSIRLKDAIDSIKLMKTLKDNRSISNIELITGEQSVEY